VRRIEDGFAFALTYGPNVDWYRNILAAGSCTLRWKGKAYKLEHPETMPDDDGLQSFPVPLRWVLEFNRIRGYFRMRVSPEAGGTAEDAELISQAAKR